MTDTPQHKIDSGFGAKSTAEEVLAGIDLSGKLAVVTGGYSGMGIETTKALVGAGAQVVVPARRPDVAKEALAGIAEVDQVDLGDLDSVRGFAQRFLASGRDIHLMINNAAIMACPEARVGPGWEAQFGTNHLGHYTLVNLLWPAIARGRGRVVALSSAGHALRAMQTANLGPVLHVQHPPSLRGVNFPEAGVIDGERRGTWIYYRVLPTALQTVSSVLMTSGQAEPVTT